MAKWTDAREQIPARWLESRARAAATRSASRGSSGERRRTSAPRRSRSSPEGRFEVSARGQVGKEDTHPVIWSEAGCDADAVCQGANPQAHVVRRAAPNQSESPWQERRVSTTVSKPFPTAPPTVASPGECGGSPEVVARGGGTVHRDFHVAFTESRISTRRLTVLASVTACATCFLAAVPLLLLGAAIGTQSRRAYGVMRTFDICAATIYDT